VNTPGVVALFVVLLSTGSDTTFDNTPLFFTAIEATLKVLAS
jgi:hypothetical protein